MQIRHSNPNHAKNAGRWICQAINAATNSVLMTPPTKMDNVPNKLPISARLMSVGTSLSVSVSHLVIFQRGSVKTSVDCGIGLWVGAYDLILCQTAPCSPCTVRLAEPGFERVARCAPDSDLQRKSLDSRESNEHGMRREAATLLVSPVSVCLMASRSGRYL